MGIIHLSIEILFDLLAILLGGILIFQSKDNFPKRYWGLIAVCIGLVFLWENIGWLKIASATPSYRFTDLLHMEKMLKWYLPASIVALFPVASLRPGFLTPFKVLAFLQIPLLITTVGICYLSFNGQVTPLTTLGQLSLHASRGDVQLRGFIFILSIITPICSALYPFIHFHRSRRINRNMYLFLTFMFLFLGIYITFTLSINDFIFNLFGFTAVVFVLSFSIAYLLQENPFSDQEKRLDMPVPMLQAHTEPIVLPLFHTIENVLQSDLSFVHPDYKLKDLAKAIGVKTSAVSAALKSGGFSSFREYICDRRLEYFKQLADTNPEKSIKELMYESGFTSKSTFYRNFTKKFGETPLKYMDR